MPRASLSVDVKVRTVVDEDADASHLGSLETTSRLGDFPYPSADSRPDYDCGRRVWYRPADPFPPTDGSPIMQALHNAKADRDRLYQLHGGLWTFVGIVVSAEVTRTDASGRKWTRTHDASVWGYESDSGRAYLVDEATSIAQDVKADAQADGVSSEAWERALAAAIEAWDA